MDISTAVCLALVLVRPERPVAVLCSKFTGINQEQPWLSHCSSDHAKWSPPGHHWWPD